MGAKSKLVFNDTASMVLIAYGTEGGIKGHISKRQSGNRLSFSTRCTLTPAFHENIISVEAP